MNIYEFFGIPDSDAPNDLLKAIRAHIKADKKIPDKILVNMLQHLGTGIDGEAVRYIFIHMKDSVTSKLRIPVNVDKKNLFEEAVTTFWEYVKFKKTDFDTSRKDAIERFLYTVCKRAIIPTGPPTSDEIPEILAHINIDIISKERRDLLLQIFDKLGKGCKEILRLFYFDRYSYEEIAELTTYAKDSAKVRRNRCIDKLKQQIALNDNLGRFIRNLLTEK